jgi:plastocyanin
MPCDGKKATIRSVSDGFESVYIQSRTLSLEVRRHNELPNVTIFIWEQMVECRITWHRIMNISIKNLLALLPITILALAAGLFSSRGATINVYVGTNNLHTFSPTNVFINTGDSVIWTWDSGPHSSTSGTNDVHADDNGLPGGLWDSGVNNSPHTFTNTFSSAGIYSYYCSIHFASGMTGQVFVASLNPPAIQITNPLAGAVFAAPANVHIQAGVTNGSAAVTNVQFLTGTTVLTNVTSSPFLTTASNLLAGNYTLTAVALDNNGLSVTNAVNISVVTPVTISLTNVFKLASTNFQFRYFANTGLDYVVLRSTNFNSWVTIATNIAASNPVVFTDLFATNRFNFYRVGRLPNP